MSIEKEITFGVSCTGNLHGLLMCLSSVLTARILPRAIQVRMEGQFPSFGNFELEQLAEFARFKGCFFEISVFKSEGVRKARQWHLDHCSTKYLWMGDDDCIYDSSCLWEFVSALGFAEIKSSDKMAYLAGCKIDLNNRRGYNNFDTRVHPETELIDGCSFNHLYVPSSEIPKVCTIDTGNALIQVENCRREGVIFTPFEDSLNSGGEDTIFGLLAHRQKLDAFFAPNAVAYHIDKAGGSSFVSEMTTRGEMLLRACDVLGLDKEKLKQEFGGLNYV